MSFPNYLSNYRLIPISTTLIIYPKPPLFLFSTPLVTSPKTCQILFMPKASKYIFVSLKDKDLSP